MESQELRLCRALILISSEHSHSASNVKFYDDRIVIYPHTHVANVPEYVQLNHNFDTIELLFNDVKEICIMMSNMHRDHNMELRADVIKIIEDHLPKPRMPNPLYIFSSVISGIVLSFSSYKFIELVVGDNYINSFINISTTKKIVIPMQTCMNIIIHIYKKTKCDVLYSCY